MRQYLIEISGAINAVFDSTDSDGNMNPGALDIEIEVTQYSFAAPIGYAHVKVWGLPLFADKTTLALQDLSGGNPDLVLGPSQITISQATDLNDCNIKVSAGMGQGLPLANPKQFGLIIQGRIFQAFGNWVETDMTLDMYVSTNQGSTQNDPANIVLDWKKGTPMADAIKTTLQRAFPKMDPPSVNINDKLVLTEDDTNHYNTLQDFNQHIFDTSKSIIPKGYNGVQMVVSGNQIIVYDGSLKTEPKQISFFDMIGQPTWIEPFKVQVNLVMRYDLTVGDYIKFPPAPTVSTEAELRLQASDKSNFQGIFQIDSVRHVGRFRQPSANSWLTVINAHTDPPDDNPVPLPNDLLHPTLVPPIPPLPLSRRIARGGQ